ncbi:Senescence/spartin-associated, C-terminal [Dillenia turbinata]|uniref:Senescence/spartin-associated, C-terminal n=1 Tax=Dillenia turbinata TaxID=194707 RepID=A0AAN8W5F8_9MAGN
MSSSTSQNPNSLYPQVITSNPDSDSPFLANPTSSPSSSSSLYPSLDPEDEVSEYPNLSPMSVPIEELLIKISGSIVHLIDKEQSIELASGDFSIVSLRQGENVIAVLARVGEDIQWPLAKDEASVKLDESHYFFTLRLPDENSANGSENLLNYGLTIASKGQERELKELDRILEKYSSFSVQKVSGGLDGSVAKETSPEDMEVSENKRELMEKSSAAYWTTLAPNVEDYSGSVARLIAAGSGQLIRGILWCGDVTVDRLKWGNEYLMKRMGPGTSSDVSPEVMRRIHRVKKLTKMSEKVASGVLSGVVKVSGFFTSSIVNSSVGKKFFSLLPGEIVLASLEGFNKVCDAAEVAGKNVMSTTSVVTTGLVSQRYGEEAARATNEGFDAAGHAIGTAWAVFKIRKALNPKSVIKPTTLVKAAADAEAKAKAESPK